MSADDALPDHLHLWDHRTAEGSRADEQGVRRGAPHRSRDQPVRRRRTRLPVPPARSRVRPARSGDGVRDRRPDRLLGWRPDAHRRRAGRGQARRPAVGAAHLREGLRRGDGDDPSRRPRRGRRGDRSGQPRPRRADRRHRRVGGGCRRVRPGRSRAVPAGTRHLRWQHRPCDLRCGADRSGDPALLLRLRRAGDGGLGDDGDDRHRHRSTCRMPTASGRSAGRSARPTSASPTTARSRSPATS